VDKKIKLKLKYREIKEVARRLRNNPTPEEKLLWDFLRKDKVLQKRILRQHPIIFESNANEHFFYIPDFYCASAKVIIEVDGRIHDYQKDRDQHRDEILKHFGLRILRIKNEELSNISEVIIKIQLFLLRTS
jgi:very-short-patch-repair endonuclease